MPLAGTQGRRRLYHPAVLTRKRMSSTGDESHAAVVSIRSLDTTRGCMSRASLRPGPEIEAPAIRAAAIALCVRFGTR